MKHSVYAWGCEYCGYTSYFRTCAEITVHMVVYHHLIGLVLWHKRVFANSLGDRSLILGQVIPKTQKMVLYAFA